MSLAAGTVGTLVFEKGHVWSPEEMAQAVLMAALFKGGGRLYATINAKREIGINQKSEAPPVAPVAIGGIKAEPIATPPTGPKAPVEQPAGPAVAKPTEAAKAPAESAPAATDAPAPAPTTPKTSKVEARKNEAAAILESRKKITDKR
jgi:hypothetical protein